jgi:hypothetical protein
MNKPMQLAELIRSVGVLASLPPEQLETAMQMLSVSELRALDWAVLQEGNRRTKEIQNEQHRVR